MFDRAFFLILLLRPVRFPSLVRYYLPLIIQIDSACLLVRLWSGFLCICKVYP